VLGTAATLLPDGTVLMSGGWFCCGYTVATAEIYHPGVLVPSPMLLSLSGTGADPARSCTLPHIRSSRRQPAHRREAWQSWAGSGGRDDLMCGRVQDRAGSAPVPDSESNIGEGTSTPG